MIEQPSVKRRSEQKRQQMPDLADYLDYREFLKDFYEFKRYEFRGSLRPYGYSHFSAAAGIKSPNYLKMIIEGRRNLSEDMIQKFAKAMRLSRIQTKEFRSLVLYGQASDASERNQFLRELSEVRVQRKLESGEIDRVIWEQVPSWVAYVIHAMIPPQGMTGDASKILRLFKGKSSLADVEQALKALTSSGLIEKNADDGRIYKAKEFMDGQEQVSPALVRKLQAELMYLGLESLFRDAPSEREMGSITLSLSSQEYEEIKFQLRKMRKSLMADGLTKKERGADERIYQVNLQLYPITSQVCLDS